MDTKDNAGQSPKKVVENLNTVVSPNVATKSPNADVTMFNKTMDLYDALKAMIQGKKITCLSWGNPESQAYFQNKVLKLRLNGTEHEWMLYEQDFEHTDYVIVS